MVVTPFENTEQIVQTLRLQFAGLFQNLLAREASLTEAKTAYDLQQTADNIKSLISDFREEENAFFNKFSSSIFANNMTINRILEFLGTKKLSIFAKDLTTLDEFMLLLKFISVDVDDPFEDTRKYVYDDYEKTKTLILKNVLFDGNENILDIRSKKTLENSIIWEETEKDDNDLPF